MGSHSVTCHPTEVRIQPLPPAEAGNRFSDSGGMQGWVDLCGELKGKMGHTSYMMSCSSISLGHSIRIGGYTAESVKHGHSATPDLRLPSRLQTTATSPLPVLISSLTEGRRLSWPNWLVTHQNGTPAYGQLLNYLIVNRPQLRWRLVTNIVTSKLSHHCADLLVKKAASMFHCCPVQNCPFSHMPCAYMLCTYYDGRV